MPSLFDFRCTAAGNFRTEKYKVREERKKILMLNVKRQVNTS